MRSPCQSLDLRVTCLLNNSICNEITVRELETQAEQLTASLPHVLLSLSPLVTGCFPHQETLCSMRSEEWSRITLEDRTDLPDADASDSQELAQRQFEEKGGDSSTKQAQDVGYQKGSCSRASVRACVGYTSDRGFDQPRGRRRGPMIGSVVEAKQEKTKRKHVRSLVILREVEHERKYIWRRVCGSRIESRSWKRLPPLCDDYIS